jgi:hypothetical protein
LRSTVASQNSVGAAQPFGDGQRLFGEPCFTPDPQRARGQSAMAQLIRAFASSENSPAHSIKTQRRSAGPLKKPPPTIRSSSIVPRVRKKAKETAFVRCLVWSVDLRLCADTNS